MRHILIYCDGGFGNRFNGLVAGLLVARRFGLAPQVVWPQNNWCGAAMADLFEAPPPALNRELATFAPERKRLRFFMT